MNTKNLSIRIPLSYILILFSYSAMNLNSQEINIGLTNGIFTDKKVFDYSVGATFEYRSSDPHVSLNSDPFLVFHSTGTSLTLPFYLKVIFGEKFRVSPSIGGLISTNRRYGYTWGFT